jgi:hypothetical protein
MACMRAAYRDNGRIPRIPDLRPDWRCGKPGCAWRTRVRQVLRRAVGRRRTPLDGGAAAELAVGTELDKLGAEGFTIEHDIDRLGAGNVDHLVCGPTGAFMIETKRSGYRMSDLLTARRRAAKLHDLLGVWVTPVICIHRRRGNPFPHERVWIVPRDRLLEWLRSQHNKPVAADQLAQALRRL